MRLASVAALASLLVSLPAAAQSLDPWATPEAPESPAPRAFVPPEPERRVGPPRERWSTGERLGSELRGGMLGMITGGVTGGTALGLLGLASCGWSGMISGWDCVGILAGVGASVGVLAGLPFGIQRGGERAGGTGSAVAAAAGVTLSTVGALLVIKRPALAVPALLSAPLLGILGYELSDSEPDGTRVTPSLSVSPGGTSLGLQGHF
jgi:hypothetical protein